MSRAEDILKRLEKGGESSIDEFIESRKSEELFLDFKRSSDNGRGNRLSDIDRNNLAKAISGFGNSEGGIIVWGVDCSRDADGADVARMKFPLENPERFVSWLEGAVSGCTIPAHSGVRNITIICRDCKTGYAVTYVPRSYRAPHQVVGKMQYYIRAGSDFVPTPHMVLAGMFGRLPQPHIFQTYAASPAKLIGEAINLELGIMIRNNGPGIATDLFCNVFVFSFPGDNCKLEFDYSGANSWTGNWSFGINLSLISPQGLRLPPEAHLQPLVLNMVFSPPFEKILRIEGTVGAGGTEPYRFKFYNTKERIEDIYKSVIVRARNGNIAEDDTHKVIWDLLNIKKKPELDDA